MCPFIAFQVRPLHNSTVTLEKSLPPLSNAFGHISRVTYSLTVGEAARLFALINFSGNFHYAKLKQEVLYNLTLLLPAIQNAHI